MDSSVSSCLGHYELECDSLPMNHACLGTAGSVVRPCLGPVGSGVSLCLGPRRLVYGTLPMTLWIPCLGPQLKQ